MNLNQQYSALGGNQQAAAVAAAAAAAAAAQQQQQQQQQPPQHPGMPGRSSSVQNSNDPFAAYSALMSTNQAAAAAAQTMSGNSASMNFPFLQQDQVQHKLAQLDEEKIYTLVLELLNPALREQALLDLSKKREQYEDLALVLWYSFGTLCFCVLSSLSSTLFLVWNRCHVRAPSGNRVGLSNADSTHAQWRCFEPRLQCPCFTAVCCQPQRDPYPLFAW